MALGTICQPQDGSGGTVYSSNVETVRSSTQQVLGAIKNIQQGVATAQANLDTINLARCCSILPGLDKIFSIAALTLGVTDDVTTLAAPRPQACSMVTNC